MNNGEQVTGAGQTAMQLTVLFYRKTQPYKEEKLSAGVVEVKLNNEPAGQTPFT